MLCLYRTDDDALKMSLPLSVLHNKDPDSEDVWMSGIIDKYRARPQTLEFEMMCLADFVSNYRIVYGRQTKGKNVHPLLNNMGFIQKRTVGKSAIIRYARFSEEKQPEKFCGTLVKLYVPQSRQRTAETSALSNVSGVLQKCTCGTPGTPWCPDACLRHS